MYEERDTAEQQKLRNLKKQMEAFEKKLEQFSGGGLENHVIIKDLTLDHPVVEKLTFHLDKLQLKEVSGALNLGNNFGVNVRPKSQSSSQPKPKSSQQSSSETEKKEKKPKAEEPEQKDQSEKKKEIKEKFKKLKKKQKEIKEEAKKEDKAEKTQHNQQVKPEEKEKPEQPKTSVSPSSSLLKATRTENGYRIRL